MSELKDEIVIAEALGTQIRIHAARSTELVEAARIAHDSCATCTAALGRTMTVTALIASDLKQPDEHVRVRISGGGPIGVIRAEADGAGNVRGCGDRMQLYASREDGHLDVGRVVGTDGTLQVSRDMGMKEPFTGTVMLASGEIGEDFARYFAISEQIPSVVSVGVLVNIDSSVAAAGGMIIQLMPFAGDDVIDEVERVAASMRPMSEYMNQGIRPEDREKIDIALRGENAGPHLGLANIVNRLRLIYEDRVVIRVTTDPGGETAVRIEIPQEDAPRRSHPGHA